MKADCETITESTGNVFADLGLDESEAAVLQLRAQTMAQLRIQMQRSRVPRKTLAQRLCLSQARLDDLLQGKWQSFSLEALIAIAARSGLRAHLELAA